MINQKEIDKYREEFKNFSDDHLIKAKYSFIPECSQHVAAVQEIEARKNNETIKQLHVAQKTHLITKWLLWLTIPLLILAIIQVLKR